MSDKFSIQELLTIRELVSVKSPAEIAAAIDRTVEDVIIVINDLRRQRPGKKKPKSPDITRMQAASRKRHLKQDNLVEPEPGQPVVDISKIEKEKRKKERHLKSEKRKIEKQKEEQRKAEKRKQQSIEALRKINKEKQFERRRYKDRQQDFSQMKTIRVDTHTFIQVPQEQDTQEALNNYQEHQRKNKIKMRIKECNF